MRSSRSSRSAAARSGPNSCSWSTSPMPGPTRSRPWASSSGWRRYDLYFVETPIDIDDLEGYAFLHDRSPIRIAAGEWQNTRFEFLDLADRGQLDVLQPDVGRVGGFTEAMRVCRIAADRDRLIVPHCWKSGIGIAASATSPRPATAAPTSSSCPIELAESPLRRELLIEDLPVVDGLISLPDAPGLGIELNRDTLRKYQVN